MKKTKSKKEVNKSKKNLIKYSLIICIILILLVIAIILVVNEKNKRSKFYNQMIKFYNEITLKYDKNINYISNTIHEDIFKKDNLKYCIYNNDKNIVLEVTDGNYYVKIINKKIVDSVKKQSYDDFKCEKELPLLMKGKDITGRVSPFKLFLDLYKIESIEFVSTNKIPAKVLGSFDVSDKNDGSVMAWYFDKNKNGYYELYIGGENGVKANPDSSYLFYGMYNIKSIDLKLLDTSDVTNMEGMFYKLSYLKQLNVSNFDTSKVTNMNKMFYYLIAIKELFLEKFDTSKVENMSEMFAGNWALEKLDLHNFDTSKVTNMNSMFANCGKLREINFKNFSTKKVKDIRKMFYKNYLLDDNCLTDLNIPNIDKIDGMFCGTQINKESKVLKNNKSIDIKKALNCK